MNKKYIVKYYGHSAYSVETKNYYLFFDYVGDAEELINDTLLSVSQSKVDFDKIKKPIVMFNSHTHFDHYNRKLNEELSLNENIYTIVGGYVDKLKNTTYLLPGDSINIKGIQINAEISTDIGVCYLIEVDGILIYYAGDNIDWGGKDTLVMYLTSMYNLSEVIDNRTLDIAFVPVCNYSGQMYESITDSAMYICREFGAKEVYPMHSKENNLPYTKFKKYCEELHLNFEVKILPKEK